MFKRFITFAFALLASAMLLVACGGQAQAQTVTFKTGDGETFGAANLYKYEFNLPGGYIRTSNINGATSMYKDDGSLPGRILQALPELVQLTGSNTYINPAYTARNVCQSGESIVTYPNSGYQIRVQDGCAMDSALKAKSK